MLKKTVTQEVVVKGYEEIVEQLKKKEITLDEASQKIIYLGKSNIKK